MVLDFGQKFNLLGRWEQGIFACRYRGLLILVLSPQQPIQSKGTRLGTAKILVDITKENH